MKDKEIVTVEETTELEESQQGPVVATQWPTEVKFTQSELSAKETVKSYSHLKQLDPDNKETYAELKLAIADVKKTRVGVGHEEKEKKEPLNKYLKLILDTSKKIREIYSTEEDRLRAEKKRIDDIRTEKKLEQQRLWQTNLGSISLLTAEIANLSQEHLINLLDNLNEYDFEALDFGDYLEQAKTAVATAVNVVTERIEFMKEQKRLADQRLWQDNLNTVRNWATMLDNETDEGLQVTIDRLENFDISSMEFGDLLEQAELSLLDASNRALLEQSRRNEKKRREQEVEDERLANEKEQQRRDEERAEADRKQAETDAENQRLRDQLAAMQKANEPEPEPEIIGADMASEPDSTVETVVETDNDEIVNITPVAGRAAAIEQEPESTVVREEEKEIADNQMDANDLAAFAQQIEIAINKGPGTLYSGKANRAVNAVYDQLNQITEYLNKTAESLR